MNLDSHIGKDLSYSGVLIITFWCNLEALQRTLEFEEELAEKFGGGVQNRETKTETEEADRGDNVSDIRKKYEKKLARHQGSGEEVYTSQCTIVLRHPT